MSPALAYWMFFNVMARAAWSIPAPKPEQKKEEA
jgi:hypothetical protein